MILDYKSIDNKTIFGSFIKFTYYNNLVPCFVYCHSENGFKKLLEGWNKASQRTMGNRYVYTFNGEQTPIELANIPSDNGHKLKSYLTCSITDVNYIM
jgi:hypothetical protein